MNNCDCSLDSCDVNGPEFHSEKIVKARKSYRCIECGSEIKKGEKYEYVTGLWDGNFSSIRTCLPCMRIRRDFCPGAFEYGRLRDTLIDCIEVDYLK